MTQVRITRWQIITVATLFIGYTGYYVCRSNLSVATPLILDEYSGQLNKQDIGGIASLGVLLYAIGKFVNGSLADYVGGRRLFLLGMAGSVLCTIVFGFASGLFFFALAWAANRFFQSMGWGALVKVSSRWFPVSIQGTIMGILASSYLVGDALGRFCLGTFIKFDVGWRMLFFIAAGTLGVIAISSVFTLKSSPEEIGESEPAANPENVFAGEGNTTTPGRLDRLLLPLLKDTTFWLVCLLSIGLTLIRETFNFWTPTYLRDVVGMSEGTAAQSSMFFPLVGALAALLGGFVTDRIRRRLGRIVLPSLLALAAVTALLSILHLNARPYLAVCLLSAVALFMMAPYSFLTGVMALDLGGKRGSATAAGLIDSAGYLGAILSGYGVGTLADRWGWNTAFAGLAATAGMTAIVGAVYCVRQEIHRRKGAFSIKSEDSEASQVT
jgi:OPA family glycerol-3-phosphate transporter-like MFS transporter